MKKIIFLDRDVPTHEVQKHIYYPVGGKPSVLGGLVLAHENAIVPEFAS